MHPASTLRPARTGRAVAGRTASARGAMCDHTHMARRTGGNPDASHSFISVGTSKESKNASVSHTTIAECPPLATAVSALAALAKTARSDPLPGAAESNEWAT